MFPVMSVLDVTGPTYTDFSSILTSLSTAIPVSTVVAVITGVLGIVIGFAFTWWGARYGVSKIWKSIRRGKASV